MEETMKFRADSEDEAQAVINGYRDKANTEHEYTLKKASYEKKEKKAKGEIIAEAYVVTITLVYGGLWDEE